MFKHTILLSVALTILSVSAFAHSEDGPVRCVRPVEEKNFWQASSSWGGQVKLFTDRKAAWISMTPSKEVRGAPACAGLEPGQKQILRISFNNPRAGYYVIQALGNDRLVVRIKDMFEFPLFTITAEPGDFTGTMVSQAIRLSDGDYVLELENSVVNHDFNGAAAGALASIMDSDGVVLVDTATEGWCGKIVPETAGVSQLK